ncbi:MAG: ATP synthase F1 subunit epsilon [Lachnospiraceae bacterium]|nr:ATP synthase F1 subunit epsilon [Lachnospiraceae bacterium]
MSEENFFDVEIVTPERVFYRGKVSMVEFNTTEGEIGVYKKHIPTTVILEPGILTLHEETQLKNAALHSGFAQILPDKVTILAELVEWPAEIDEERALSARTRAEERLNEKAEGLDVDRANIALKKAICRLNVLK